MKSTLSLSLFLFLTAHYSMAQRYVPLIAEERSLTEQYQGPNDLVNDMIIYNDKLLIVGEFTEINQEPINSIAYWDGLNYSEFDVPFATPIYIRDVLETPLGLVISGNFEEQNHILVYNGSSWEQLGGGFDDVVQETIWFEGKLWAGGKFDWSGTSLNQKISYYENGTWVQAGSGFDDEVRDLIVFQEELYAVGEFDYSGSTSANHIAKWNGASWLEVAGGLNGDANTLTIYENQLFIGGNFNASADGLTELDEIVVLDGEQFQVPFDLSNDIQQVGYMSHTNGHLFIAQGMNSISIINTANKGLVYSNNQLEDIHFDIGFLKTIEFQDEIIFSNGQVSIESNDRTFYSETGLGIFKPNGRLEEEFFTNSIQTSISCSPGQFNDVKNGRANYHTEPLEENLSTIFAAAPWMGGISDELQMSHHTFTYESDDVYYRMGPISNVYDQAYVNRYFRVWKTSAQEISDHIASYDQPNYVMPESILSWPGNGRVEYGESSHLAPFIDVNENGWYEPNLGDYPSIEGNTAVFYILAGSRGEANNNLNTLDADICVLHYGYVTDNEDLSNTTFVRYRIINKSSMDFSDFKFGFWVDGDLGNFGDDYVGCSPEKNTFYTYNGDSDDEGIIGYGINPPSQGVRFLNQELTNHVSYNNSTGQNGVPQNSLEHWNYLNSIWRNGLPMTHGGDGFTTGNDPDMPAFLMYPSDPWISTLPDSLYWSESSAGHFPSDRRSLGAASSLELNAGDELCYDLALVTAFPSDPLLSHLFGIENMLIRSDVVQDYYNENVSVCGPETFPLNIQDSEVTLQNSILFPNPATNTVSIKGLERLTHSEVRILDITGKKVKSIRSQLNQLDISDLESGTYLVLIMNNENVLARHKLIKER